MKLVFGSVFNFDTLFYFVPFSINIGKTWIILSQVLNRKRYWRINMNALVNEG